MKKNEMKESGFVYLTLKEKQAVLLELLEKLCLVLDEHNIKYSIDAGTLLGAVRHQGFIPWDDDVDVLVPRPDYERLLCHPEWIPEGYAISVCCANADLHTMPYVKFCDLRYRAQEKAFEGKLKEYLWADVFPADAVPEGDAAMDLVREQRRLIVRAARRTQNVQASRTGGIKLVVKKVLFPIIATLSPATRIYQRVVENATRLEYGSTSRIGNISWLASAEPNWMSADAFEELIEMEFEGKTFKAVSCWDEALRISYGDDYMQLPPVECRVSHDTKVWRVS